MTIEMSYPTPTSITSSSSSSKMISPPRPNSANSNPDSSSSSSTSPSRAKSGKKSSTSALSSKSNSMSSSLSSSKSPSQKTSTVVKKSSTRLDMYIIPMNSTSTSSSTLTSTSTSTSNSDVIKNANLSETKKLGKQSSPSKTRLDEKRAENWLNSKNHVKIETEESPERDNDLDPHTDIEPNGNNRNDEESMASTPLTPISPPTPVQVLSDDNSEEESAFILSRIEAQNAMLAQDPKNSNFETLKANFQAVKDSMTNTSQAEDTSIDWDFWGKLINDYEGQARRHPRTLTRKIQGGIPDALRGMVWILICKGKNPDLEKTYANLISKSTPFDKMITRDLARTFPKHEHFQRRDGLGQESLYNVLKAYSLYDPEVGYCQGISFIVAPLLLNMPDEEAFCVLDRLMKAYSLRGMFTPEMDGLQLRLYQYDKLLEDLVPRVHQHFIQEGVRSTMYASQWFLTLFAYKFPLTIVYRILDVVFAEGFEALFRFAFALLKENEEQLLKLDFEALLGFLKIGLFETYTESVDQLVQDAAKIHISKRRVDKLAKDFIAEARRNDPDALQIESLKAQLKQMAEENKVLEGEMQIILENQTRMTIELDEAKLEISKRGELIEALETQVDGLKGVLMDERRTAEDAVKEETERLAHRNLELTKRNEILEDQLSDMEQMLADVKLKWAECDGERVEYLKNYENLKKSLEL